MPVINKIEPGEQAEFRSNHDQTMAFKRTEKENSRRFHRFNRSPLHGMARRPALYISENHPLSDLLKNMLSNRLFVVHTNNSKSNIRVLNNGFPQGSVLAPSPPTFQLLHK